MFKAFIVDDEPMARSNLLDAISGHPQWQVVKTLPSGKTLLEDVQNLQPDVVFLDIQMPGENGLELAKQLLTLAQPPLIVFVTAFSDYAVTAFELYALDYLLKPFDDARVAVCINKLNQAMSSQKIYQDTLSAQNAWAHTKPLNKIVIKSSNSLRIIPTGEIQWLAANGNYVDIHHREGVHLLRGSMKNLFASLPQAEFVQIHRGFAVRTQLIRELKTLDEERSLVVLANGEELPIGKSFKAAVIQLLCMDNAD